jgi:predicted dehydrogenase
LFTVSGARASGSILGANDVIRIGVVGVGGRGGAHVSEFCRLNGVQVTHLIDPDSSRFEARSKQVQGKGGKAPTCVQDVRQALDDKNLDAISVATCNHWHSLATVWACQAGKDVYVEKPISHNVFEGRKCAEAAKKYGRVVQHGAQQRSDEERARQMAAIHSGKYGKLLVAKGYCCKPRWSIGFKPITTPPAQFDFNMWLGPAPLQAFHENLHPYNWHWFWDFGNGDTGNQGVHEMDVARWGIKDATLPTKVWSVGGRFTPDGPDGKDQGQTPNMQLALYEFGDVLLVFETRGLVGGKMNSPAAIVANEFYTTDGMVNIKDGKFHPNRGGEPQPIQLGEAKVTPGGAFGSFIAAVRSRKPEDINVDAQAAHYSSALCHLGNISYRLGQPAPLNKKPEGLGDNEQAVKAFEAIQDNLKAVGYKLEEITCQVGPALTLDPKAETFVGNDQANALLTRPYRGPFVVPENV